ncbi:uncharacterized protein ATNIH1004_006510 [Aspergillus tanneri]|uniref:Major facilitator superfamily (MFS) profile domain-containing protein n=1 Tax=Aspergillus tanneri TaxID=1220188 RepID=A0A5M9MT90_9EURO|nr:uncharacterized protein ATNIH1004_006510 [Aspergillus tanneri]KAA8647809.1 hypothetical protein ATNIH1004_006510 [Aspergillus tanneri]
MSSQSSNAADDADRCSSVPWLPSMHDFLIMIIVSVLAFMIALDAAVIVISLTVIIADLDGNVTQGLWVRTSYLLTSASTMQFVAALSDIFGRAGSLITSLELFTIGTILCCVSTSIAILLVGRCIQGLGDGGILILGIIVYTDIDFRSDTDQGILASFKGHGPWEQLWARHRRCNCTTDHISLGLLLDVSILLHRLRYGSIRAEAKADSQNI